MAAAALHNAPLRLFWWKAAPNFGDALSRIVTAYVSGRDTAHSGPGRAELFAVGSILQIVRRNYADRPDGSAKPWIWGSGLLHAVPRDFLKKVEVVLLRGPVTASLLGLSARRFGDPGLLIAEALGDKPARSGRIGLVPHLSQADDAAIHELAAANPVLDLIDVRGDAAEVCRRIAACAHVFASSLHGLVTADAYGVPSTWMDPGREPHLKYLDYAASIGRPLTVPAAWDEIPARLAALPDTDTLPYADGIARAQADLHETFPAPLRAIPDAGAA